MLRYSSIFIICVLSLSVCLQGCSPKKTTSKSLTSTCNLPTDQGTDSLLGAWQPLYSGDTTKPIKLFLDPKFESNNMIDPVVKAADTWNKYTTKVYGFNVFDYSQKPASFPTGSDPKSICDDKLLTDRTADNPYTEMYIFYIDDVGYWEKFELDSTAMGVTISCFYQGKSNHPYASRLIMGAGLFMNFEYYFSSCKGSSCNPADLESVALHELGHVLGLDHSCGAINGASGKKYLDCPWEAGTSDTSADSNNNTDSTDDSSFTNFNHPYRTAVMYWVLGLQENGTAEVKKKLMKNDTDRINCLYGW